MDQIFLLARCRQIKLFLISPTAFPSQTRSSMESCKSGREHISEGSIIIVIIIIIVIFTIRNQHWWSSASSQSWCIMSVLNMTFRFTDGLNPQVVLENNPQARHVPPIFLEPYCSTNTFFTGCNFFAVSPWPVPQVQWYSAVQTHPTNSRIWTFTTNRTANYLPGNFRSWTTCAFFQQSAKINLHSTPPSGQLVAVKSKCCGRTIPRSYSFKEVSSSHSSQCVLFNGPHHISQGSWSLREFDGQDSHVECLDSTQWWDNILSINCIYFLLFWCYCCSQSKIFMFGEDFSLPPLQTWWSPLLCLIRMWESATVK